MNQFTMPKPTQNSTALQRLSLRRGLTLAELLIATTIMVMIAGAMATLASAVHSANDHCRGQLDCAQHARVALNRIEQAMERAYANEQFPACLIVAEQVGSQSLPQTLVLWSPIGTPANATGLPLVSELVVFSPDPSRPGVLLEIRSPTDNSVAPPVSDGTAWWALAEGLRASQTVQKITLTDRLRTAPLSGAWSDSLTAAELRGVVRFRRLLAPTEQEWADYRAGTRAWNTLAWPLDSYRTTSGTRAVVCQTELQLVVGNMASAATTAVPFFGSASMAYELER